jgi:hypothetical protein
MGAAVMCAHGGQAVPTAPSPRVFVSSMPIAIVPAPYTVAGCAFAPPAGSGPCVTAQWTVGAVRVLSLGQPVAIMTGMSSSVPTATPLLPGGCQTRVIAT